MTVSAPVLLRSDAYGWVDWPQGPRYCYSREQAYSIDRALQQHHAVSEITLIRRAARVAWQLADSLWNSSESWVVMIGSGHNGADGLALASIAANHGKAVSIVDVSDKPDPVKGSIAYELREHALQAGCKLADIADTPDTIDLVVDAILGLGGSRALSVDVKRVVDKLASKAEVMFSLDIPTGIDADTGALLGDWAVTANVTLCLLTLKRGLLTGVARNHTGDLYFSDIGLGDAELEGVVNDDISDHISDHISDGIPLSTMPVVRSDTDQNAHKAKRGHALCVAGEQSMAGASVLAAQACLHLGVGYLTMRASSVLSPLLLTVIPQALSSLNNSTDLDDRYTAALIGPGLGRTDQSVRSLTEMLQWHIRYGRPLVIDADALRLLAATPDLQDLVRQSVGGIILTPHVGEAAALLDMATSDIEANRWQAVERLSERYGCTVVLKGPGTLVAQAEAGPDCIQGGTQDRFNVSVCPAGNAILATGGTGDILAGMILALLANSRVDSGYEAAIKAVRLHATTADHYAISYEAKGLDCGQFIRQIPT